MANVENLEKRLLELINTEDHFAIALTGEWGIGKTHFWNNFYKKNHTKFETKKYAYVSLFGIESLESLKFEIALKSHSTSQKKDTFSFIKKGFQKSLDVIDFSKIEGKGVALSLSKGMVSSAISSMITDTVICIDDIERHSNKLDIKDVMGLVNHLNLEKKCKIVVLLDEEKAKTEFVEYKEKVFDDILILDDSLAIIEQIVNNEVFPIYKSFYRTLGIKNLRFYQRTNKTHELFNEVFPQLSKTSKEQVLKFILIIRIFYDMPHIVGKDVDFNFFIKSFNTRNINELRGYIVKDSSKEESETPRNIEKFNKIDSYIHPFYNYFQISNWGETIVSWITDLDFDKEFTKKLIEKDNITEEKLMFDRLNSQLLAEFHNMEIQPNFAERLYYVACARIGAEQLNNLSFYCDILEASKRLDLASQLESHVKRHIEQVVDSSLKKPSIDDWYFLGKEPNDRFHSIATDIINNYKINNFSSDTVFTIFLNFHESNRRSWNDDKGIFKIIDKDILKKVIWTDIFRNIGNRKLFIHSILLHPSLKDIKDKHEEIRLWILDLLQEKIIDNPNSEPSINMWLKNTNNLTENLT